LNPAGPSEAGARWTIERVRSSAPGELAAAIGEAVADVTPAGRVESEFLAHLVAGFGRDFDDRLIDAMLPFTAEHPRLMANRCFPLQAVDRLLSAQVGKAGAHSIVHGVLAVAARRGGHPVSPATARALLQLPASSAKESAALAQLRIFTAADDEGVVDAAEIRRRVRAHYAATEMHGPVPSERDAGGRLLVENPQSTPEQAIALLAELPSPELASVIGGIIVDGTRAAFEAHQPLMIALRPFVDQIEVAQAMLIAGPTLEDVLRSFDVLAETEYLSETVLDARISPETLARLGPERAARLLADPDPDVQALANEVFGGED
jgi:hypothetical protein